MSATTSSPVTDPTQVAVARRTAVALAKANGFDEEAAGRVALVATELATNLVKHGGGGYLLSGASEDADGTSCVELIALDKGPSIPDLVASFQDGVSTAGTPGNGLGAVVRQSRSVRIFSRPGAGTAVIARVAPGRVRQPATGSPASVPRWGAVNVPYPGEEVCGDDWDVRSDPHGLTLMVVDGLGHGPLAAEAANEAKRLFDKHWRAPPAEIIESMHAGLRGTRGAAIAVARLDLGQQRLVFAGVGNIVGTIVARDGKTRRVLSHNGTVGHAVRKIQAFDYPIEEPHSATIVLHSDGVSGSWSPDAYPGLFATDPALIAAVLYRDFSRGRDDATVLVAQGGSR